MERVRRGMLLAGALLVLAGVRATRTGFEINPHLRGRFSLRFARVGVARGENALLG